MAKGIAEQSMWDADTSAIIRDGASVNQLALLFRVSEKLLRPKLMHLAPSGYRGQYPIYAVHEVAPLVVKPVLAGDMAAVLKRMNHKDLPPLLAKEFWQGMSERRRYELKAQELWETDEVLKAASAAFGALRMALLLVPDELERITQLSDEQKDLIQVLIDRVMEAARARLIDTFADTDDHTNRGLEPGEG